MSLQSPPASPPSAHSPSPPPLRAGPELPYDAAFADTLMTTILSTSSNTGVTVLPRNATASARERSAASVRVEDIDPPAPIPASSLPLDLDDPRRVYKSLVPGVRLTHPGGMVEGGAAAQPVSGMVRRTEAEGDEGEGEGEPAVPEDVQAYARHMIAKHGIRNATSMRKWIRDERDRQLGELRGRMEERREAVEGNARVEAEIGELEAMRAMERRIEQKMRKT